ncbi:Ferric enterobactin transport system permease protein FepD [Microbacterium oxydans]|uniref:Ferric enterobactin transport system permease protein FepD n=1 Tax=Microbacterium oxydans TaxID=82380 RepID=A0A3S9WNN8_9MICO|nr:MULTISPECIES: iron chelate uptake ABC transporter family permease subunit [Microbacterium]AZS41704.1 Ferric enterobactin transport system permease protein FepD [Microbacterium oxydans]
MSLTTDDVTDVSNTGAGSREGGSPHRNGTLVLGLVIAAGVLAIAAIASLAVGAGAIDPVTVLQSLFTYDDENPLHLMVMELRVPRTLLGIVVGAALAVCGGLIQAFTRNPLADPGILGVNAGASFAVTFVVGVLGFTTPGAYVPFALGGAFVLTLLVYILGSFGASGATPMKLTLAGVALGAAFTGFTTAIVLRDTSTLQVMRFWGVGSIGGRTIDQLTWAVPLIVAGLLIGLLCARSLNALALGDDLAQALGARVRVTRILVIIAVTLLAGTSVAAAGPIAFVGLMIPHIVRWFTGPDQRWVLAYSMIIGPAFLLLADILGRIVLPNGEMRVGIVTALLGAPILIVLVRRKRVSGL